MNVRSRFLASLAALALLGGAFASPAFAQNGTWITLNGTTPWSTATNWSGNVTASGADNTANFTANINAALNVTLDDVGREIGNITFTDSTTNSHDMTISGSNALTLDRTSGMPTINVTQSGRILTISSQISGNDGLLKSGAGTLLLSGNNDYSGGTEVSAGTITVGSNTAFGTGAVTVTGTSRIDTTYGSFPVMANALHVNGGVTLTTVGSTQYFGMTFSGAVTGNGTIRTSESGNNSNSGNKLGLTSASNTFTGTLVNSGGTAVINVNSLGDGGAIQLYTGTGGFALGAGTATSLVFNTRQIQLFGDSTLSNNNANASTTFTVGTNLAFSGAGVRTLTLGGTNTGTNAFSGNITNNGLSATAITKSGAGTWALGGTNTYSGDTNLSAVSGSRLIFQGNQSLSPNTKLIFAQSSSAVASVRFLDDGAGTISFNRPIEFGGTNTSQVLGIFVGNNNTANGGSSSGTTTGSTIQVGGITHTSLAADTATWNLNATGANGYRLQTGNLTLNNLVNRTAGQTTAYVLNPTSANMTVAAIGMASGNMGSGVDGIPIVRLDGTSTDNYVAGAISNAANVEAVPVRLEKTSTSTWTLNGTNTYTGTTTVSGGLLRFTGNSTLATGAVSVTAGSLGGNGGSLGGTVTVSSTGGIDLRDNAIGNLTLGSTLNITGAAGANNLRFNMGNGTLTSDQLIVGGTTTVTNNQSIDLNWLGGASGRATGNYTLIGGAGTLDATNAAKFSLPITKAFGQSYSLFHDSGTENGNLQVIVANVTAATPAAFWAGGGNNWSTTTNWRASLTGNDSVAGAPDYETNVTFSTTTPTPGNLLTNVLDVDFDINSLTFTNASPNVTIAGPGALTLEAAAVNGNTLGNGINSLKTSGTNTISARVALASSQTWTVASGGTLAVSGVISDFGLGYGLTKAGAGTLTISTNPTYTGATIANGGTLDVSGVSGNPLSSSSGLTFNGTSTFTYSATNITLPSTTINSSVTANFRNVSNGGIFTFTIPSLSGSGTFSGDNPGGTGQNKIIAFSDLSNFTGVLQMSTSGASFIYQLSNLNDTVASNIRFAGNAQSLANPNRLRYVGSAGLTLTNRAIELANASNSFVAIDNNGTNNSSLIINSNLAVTTAGAKTLILGGSNTSGTSTFAGTITNGNGTISVTKADANTWSLTSANNTFTGAITLNTTTTSAGTLAYASAGGANPISFLQTTGSATLSYIGSADQTVSGNITASALTTGTITLNSSGTGAVNYSSTASLGSAGSGNKNLILSGTNTANNTLAGAWVNNTGGAATLTKNGVGKWVLSGNNTYTGVTTVNAGTLSIPTITNVGTAGPLGNATSAILLGSAGGNTGTLEYTGSTASSNRSFTAVSGGTARFNVTTAGQTLTLSGILLANGNFIFDGAGNSTIGAGGGVSSLSTGTVTKNGTGSLSLEAPGHAGNFVMNQGTLNVNVTNAFGSAASLTLAPGATLDNTSGANLTVINTALEKNLGDSLNYTGTGGYRLSLGDGTSNLSDNTTFTISAGTLAFGGNVLGSSFGITKEGLGVLEFGNLGAGAFAGNSTINAGEVLVSSGTLQGGSSTTINVLNGGTLRIGASGSAGGVNVLVASGGNYITTNVTNGNITFTGSRTLTADDENWNGTQTLQAGVAITSAQDWLGTVPGSPTPGRIVMETGSSLISTDNIEIDANKGILLSGSNATFSSASGSIFIESIVAGSGKLIKTGTQGFRLLSTANTYAGGTDILQGTFGIMGDGSLGAGGTGVFLASGATFNSAQESGNQTITVAANRTITLEAGGTSNIDARTTSTFVINGEVAGVGSNLRINTVAPTDRQGTVVLAGANTYTGSTTVRAGTLRLNGSIQSSSVVVDSGASFGGSGVASLATLSGSGSIDPGNSPGIMTIAATDPTGGLDYNFEFTQANTLPNWSSSNASINDVLRLTSGTPFTGNLTAGNVISLYFDVPSVDLGDVYTGGFYTDNNADFLSTISGATFQYFLENVSGNVTYNGNNYFAYTGPNTITASTVAQTADFGAGPITGFTTQFTVVVPEPTTMALLASGVALLGFRLARRRKA